MGRDGTRVMIVDEDEEARRVVTGILEAAGLQVSGCAGGPEAIALLQAERPRVIIMDLVAPTQAGADFYHRLRQLGDRTPVVVLAAYARTHADRRLSPPASAMEELGRRAEALIETAARV
jgi:CheY-like chemotaxis protein